MKKEGFDFDKEYGIVLEGGGAKGAYQIGVWKALVECGVKIKGVAGVSVGALNGALMCMGDLGKAEEIWSNISYSQIMRVDDTQMEKFINRKFKELDLSEIRKQSINLLVGGGFDSTPLKELIEEHIDEEKIKKADIEFIMGTFSVSQLKEMEITAKEAEEGYLKDYVMASAYFPLFKNQKLHGKTYLDGGIVNNVPIDMLINRGYKDIIVVRIFGIGVEKKVKIPEEVNVTYIAPKVNLCNVLEFNRKKAKRNITLGYYDALRSLKPLAGNDYYIVSEKDEIACLDALMHVDEEAVKNLLVKYKKENLLGLPYTRLLTEEITPFLATIFKLGKKWNYRELYYSILEYSAKKIRLHKYKIYEENEFYKALEEKIKGKYQNEENADPFMEISLSILKYLNS